MSKVFVCHTKDRDSNPGRVKSKTQKMVLDIFLHKFSIIKYSPRLKWINPGK